MENKGRGFHFPKVTFFEEEEFNESWNSRHPWQSRVLWKFPVVVGPKFDRITFCQSFLFLFSEEGGMAEGR